MLLVDHGEPERFEFHAVFEQGVGAYDDMYLARGKGGKYLAARLGAGAAGEQGGAKPDFFSPRADCGIVLAGEYLGGGHQA